MEARGRRIFPSAPESSLSLRKGTGQMSHGGGKRLAADGLELWGVDPGDAKRLLGIIEQRCVCCRTGATWQTDAVRALAGRHGTARQEALRLMTLAYIEQSRTNEPVHCWPQL